jgi:rhamnose transport system permease protein
MKRDLRDWSAAGALALLLIFLAFKAPAFYELQPMLSRLTRAAPVLIVSLGMAMVVIARQIDISVGSQFGICSVCAGLLAARGWPMPAVLLASGGLGLLMGSFNGLLVAGLQLPSIVVTLATMVIWREGLRWLREGQFVNLPERFQWFGQSQTTGQVSIIVVALLLLVILGLALKHLRAGRFVYAVGSDAEAARLAGIRPHWVTFGVFAFLGLLAGLAAFLNIAQSPQVDPKSGTGLELQAIAAAVVGGVAVSGGRGKVWGVFAGAMLLACISPALTYLHVEAYWEKAIQGSIILLAVMVEGLRRRKGGLVA